MVHCFELILSKMRFAALIDGWFHEVCQFRSTPPLPELNVNVPRLGFFVMAR